MIKSLERRERRGEPGLPERSRVAYAAVGLGVESDVLFVRLLALYSGSPQLRFIGFMLCGVCIL